MQRHDSRVLLARGKARFNLWFLSLCGLVCALPAPALAQRPGGRLTAIFLMGPMVVPAIGFVLAALGLRLTRARALWRILCGLLALNAALLGGLFALVPDEALRVFLVLGHAAQAGTMLLTFPKDRQESKLTLALKRVWVIVIAGTLPGVLTWLALR